MLDRASVSDALRKLVAQATPALPADRQLALDDNLHEAGLTSMGMVKLMLSIEAEFALAIPDAELTPANFSSLGAMQAMVARLRQR